MPYVNAHAARINDANIVQEVIVIPYMGDNDNQITEYCNSIGLTGRWLDTSYLGARRGKFAGIGDRYDSELDKFIDDEYEEFLKTENFNTPPPTDEEIENALLGG